MPTPMETTEERVNILVEPAIVEIKHNTRPPYNHPHSMENPQEKFGIHLSKERKNNASSYVSYGRRK